MRRLVVGGVVAAAMTLASRGFNVSVIANRFVYLASPMRILAIADKSRIAESYWATRS